MPVTVKVSGPLFDGQASAAVRDWMNATRRDLARQAQSIIQSKARRWNKSGRGGTGRAAASVVIRPSMNPVVVEGVSDKGAVWWPWLEGTSHRNSTTRFRGYHAFRLARGIVNKRARKLAEAKLPEYIGRMGGR